MVHDFSLNSSKPHLGEYITVTSNYTINNKNGWSAPFISYDITILRLVNISTTDESGSRTTLSLINPSILGGNNFITVWTFETINEGGVNIWGPYLAEPLEMGTLFWVFQRIN